MSTDKEMPLDHPFSKQFNYWYDRGRQEAYAEVRKWAEENANIDTIVAFKVKTIYLADLLAFLDSKED